MYIGRYTDPNHEGGYRVITLLDEMDGDKRIARCEGIGGAGEPASFVLPAWVNADGSIVIDFSAPPKGGPKDFHGTWDEDGIKFTKDGNKWPKVPQLREDNLTKFLNNFDEQEVPKDEFMDLYSEFAQGCPNDD